MKREKGRRNVTTLAANGANREDAKRVVMTGWDGAR